MNSKDILEYKYMTDLNLEAQQMIAYFNPKWIKQLIKNNMLLISLEETLESEETSEWVGFVKTMKIFIHKKFNMNSDQLKEVKDDIKEIKAGQAKMEAKIEAGQAEMKAEMKASLEAIMAKLEEKK